MPYALFCQEAKLSKAYPTEADVWKLARQSGLVVDAVSDDEKPEPRPVLDNDYEIRPCDAEPNEDPARNKVEAEGDAWTKPKETAKGGAAMTRLLLLLLFVLLAPVTAQAGVAEQALTRANVKVRAAVLHDVCEHGWAHRLIATTDYD